ncbi:hypothetical protein LTR47_007963 [Exophiala xenobiotica]|nr:hypothetical protein LTR41_002773 [Exophiala xenobiotica]KAK5218680.1 hypothetical protein LTR72_008619 [Exophiala xenobiotica]KAK5229072.1 hypothetical protein LTR47_007963 [Exophiala xenobiotica]KAK5252992.1 hypothetical protein LTS06_002450 [Exophiala xenobiotica]KAK5290343.1 hypothetical protein LTR14_006646 [Exophiala xenobiotica]
MDLVELYFEIVYPIFPLFHQPTFVRSVARGEYSTRRTLFASTMAVCALVAARARDAAVYNPRWDIESLQEVDSEVFYAEAALQSADEDLTPDHNLMRAHAILAICAIQYGKARDMHKHLGRYHTLVAMDGLHDEANWPRNIGIVETEERRRIFWSIYTLDIYTSVVWGGVIRCREQQSNVSYPTEIDDELFSDSGFSSRASMSPAVIGPSPSRNGVQVQSSSWLCGWNFITDLYRVLEHVITHFRDRRSRLHKRSFLHDIFKDQPGVSQSSVRDSVMQMYINLPQCFKETHPITYDIKQDRFGFQAANITATIQLLRMVLFAAGGASIEERCQIANEVIGAFNAVPVAYLKAISSPLTHHLGGIGQILGSVFEEPLSDADYNRVRSVMLAMAQLLSNLEGIQSSASASERLRVQVARIDEYMASQRNAVNRAQQNIHPSLQTLHADSDPMHFAGLAAAGSDGSVAMSPFQVPHDLWGDFNWIFDFTQPLG